MPVETGSLNSIALEYLFEGMLLTQDIYNFNGRVLLLPKGTVLTHGKISQLKNFNSNYRNISVHAETYQLLLERGIAGKHPFTQSDTEEKVGYTDIKKTADVLLQNIYKTGKIARVEVDSLADEITKKLTEVDASLIFQCINAPEPIDEYLCRHSINVSLLNGMMGEWLKLPGRQVNELILAGLVHDVGKTKIPLEILDAPRRLTVSEFEVIKMHPVYSFKLLDAENQFSEQVMQGARHHHETMNGGGYPDGLVGDQISLFARITAISDIYDAMVSKRSYKEANNPLEIITQLSKQQFSDLDMGLVKIFTDHMPSELVGKTVLMSDGSIGTIRYLVQTDLEHPLVDIDGVIKMTNKEWHCKSMISNP